MVAEYSRCVRASNSGYRYPTATATISRAIVSTNVAACSFHVFLNHWPQDMPARPSDINSTALVGYSMFEKPSPKAKACTAICLDTPDRSASGDSIGISRNAWHSRCQ